MAERSIDAYLAASDKEREAERMRSEQEAGVRVPSIVKAESRRLGLPADIDAQEDPVGAAAWLEKAYGTLDQIPSWYNAAQFSKAGVDYAMSSPEGRGVMRAARFERPLSLATPSGGYPAPHWASDQGVQRSLWLSQSLLSPGRYEYMQEGPGRFVDLLRSPSPVQGLEAWDRSNNARTARRATGEANYGRYGGFGNAVAEALRNKLNPVSAYLSDAEIIPNAVGFYVEGNGAPGGLPPLGTAGQALIKSGYTYNPSTMGFKEDASAQRPAEGLNDYIPDQARPLIDAFGRAGARHDMDKSVRLGQVPVLDVPAPPENATPEQQEQAEKAYFAREKELSQMASALRPPSGQYMAEKITGRPLPPAVGDAVDTVVGALDPSLAASVFAALPGAIAGKGLLGGLRSVAWQEGWPEAALTAGINTAATVGSPRSWAQYAFSPSSAQREELDTEERNALAHRAEVQFTAPDAQNIWEERVHAAREGGYYDRKRRGGSAQPAP
jgi:hypothetical protein